MRVGSLGTSICVCNFLILEPYSFVLFLQDTPLNERLQRLQEKSGQTERFNMVRDANQRRRQAEEVRVLKRR